MKLMFCIQGIFNSGGMERVLINRVNYFIEKYQYECIIVTTDQKKRNTFFELNNKTIYEDLEINYSDNNGNFIKRVIKYLEKQKKHKKKLQELVNLYKPDIIVSLGDNDKYIIPNLKGHHKSILEHHFEKKARLRENRGILYKIKEYIFLIKEKQLLYKYNEFLVLTEEDKKQWGNKKVKKIENPLTFYDERSASLTNKKVIVIGRLTYQKGYDFLLKIWKRVIEEYPEWILNIYGDGEEKEKIENFIKVNRLEQNIFLRGKEKNIQEKYLESSIYLMTSRYEGMPMVLLEAMSCGLPIVSFDCPCGPKDLIMNNQNGFICKFGDIDSMVNKIILLIENEEKRKQFGKNSKICSREYLEDKVMKKWKNLLESLVVKDIRGE